jgi:hypothetical protein
MANPMQGVSESPCCPVCQGAGRTLIFLDAYPVTEIYQAYRSRQFSSPVAFDQGLNYCEACSHAYLRTLLPRDFIYGNYNTHSRASIGSVQALDNFFDFVSAGLTGKKSVIIDIGANDATLLKRYQQTGSRLVGIDPNANSDDPGIECIKDYVENVDLAEIASENRLFLCSHTLEHIFDPAKFLLNLARMARASDDFFFQFPSLDLLVRDGRFDQVHHQHVNYFSLRSFTKLLHQCGFEPVACRFDSDHYGALMCHFRKSKGLPSNVATGRSYSSGDILLSYQAFKSATSGADLRLSISSDEFSCYGASLMLPILGYYMPTLANAREILDSNKDKFGLSYVNFDIEIRDESAHEYADSNIVVTAISTKLAARRIVKRLFELQARNVILPYNTL